MNKNKMSVHKKELITDGVKMSVLSVIPEGVLGGRSLMWKCFDLLDCFLNSSDRYLHFLIIQRRGKSDHP